MKTKNHFLTLVLILITAFSVNAQSTLSDILTALAGQKPSFSNVKTQRFVVNSSGNARFSGGKTRDVVKVELPKGTEKWYYRVTVLEKSSTYEYESNETFYYLLSNNKKADTYSSGDAGVDIYILGHSGDVSSFKETGNNSFRCFQKYTRLNTKTTVGVIDNTLGENLWLGIKNPNSATGVQVIVEIVASGHF